jgi:hypothetical protein
MAGSAWLATGSSSPRTTALAARDDANEILRVLLGRHWQGSAADVSLDILGYPYSFEMVRVELGRVPHDPVFFSDPPRVLPLPEGPVDSLSLDLPVQGSRIELDIPGFASNDAYVITIHGSSESASEANTAPALGLDAPYPNPSNPHTTFCCQLPAPGRAVLEIFDPSGRRVRILHDGFLDAGEHLFAWRGLNEGGDPVAAGVYLVRLSSGDGSAGARLILLR